MGLCRMLMLKIANFCTMCLVFSIINSLVFNMDSQSLNPVYSCISEPKTKVVYGIFPVFFHKIFEACNAAAEAFKYDRLLAANRHGLLLYFLSGLLGKGISMAVWYVTTFYTPPPPTPVKYYNLRYGHQRRR